MTVLFVAWGGLCAVWGGLLVAQARARRDGLFLELGSGPDSDTTLAADSESVCVVIPARNEATDLADCLRRVLDQDHGDLSVVVVDDRSEDETLSVARGIERTDARLRVEHIDDLPPGWMGKSHALWRATRSVEADWLLFVDVDCVLEPGAIKTALAEAGRRNVELLTLWPRQAPGGFWEHLTIPLCAAIIALWFGSPRVNDASRRLAFANGQFLLFDRRAYHRIGGHQAVQSAIIEDIPLAECAKRAGVPCWVASGRDLVAVRMYRGFRAVLNGWSRIYVGALRSGGKLGLSIVWLMLGSLLPYGVAVGLALSWTGSPLTTAYKAAVALCAAHLLLMLAASYRFWGMGGCKRIYLTLYPVSVALVMFILARSWWWLVVRRRIVWRDTSYAIDGQGRIVP
ncbi:MAG: glycosyltransferase [Phycisphaerae bacterium]